MLDAPVDNASLETVFKATPCTDEEWEQLPKTELTSEQEWAPSCLDFSIDDIDKWAEAVQALKKDRRRDMHKPAFDEMGCSFAVAWVIWEQDST